jgi:hypothetical protein
MSWKADVGIPIKDESFCALWHDKHGTGKQIVSSVLTDFS